MTRQKSTVSYTVIEDLSVPPEQQKGTVIQIEGRGGDTPQNRKRALEVALSMFENGELTGFPDGLSLENIVYAPPSNESATTEENLRPIQRAAREALKTVELFIAKQEAIDAATPCLEIIEIAAANNGKRLSSEQIAIAKDKAFGKTINNLADAIAAQESFLESAEGLTEMIAAIVRDGKIVATKEDIEKAVKNGTIADNKNK